MEKIVGRTVRTARRMAGRRVGKMLEQLDSKIFVTEK
jgi:hypothetical protein